MLKGKPEKAHLPGDRCRCSGSSGSEGLEPEVQALEFLTNGSLPDQLVLGGGHSLKINKALVKGKYVTGFANGEEEDVQLTHLVPFLVEDELMRLGAVFERRADWQPLSIVDGRLITGQNSASSTVAAQNVLNLLAAEKAA
jgi:putative intracellular protease/amidase